MRLVIEFLVFFDAIKESHPMHLEIGYSKIMDWCIHIWRKGTGEDGKDQEVLLVQSNDLEYAFAKAQVMLKDWLIENMGGY